MKTKRDYYEVLGVSRDADAAAIKKAYRKLAKKYHPDTNSGDARAAEEFKEVTEAYSVLSDEKKRKLYDQFGHAAFEEGGGASQAGGAYQGTNGGYREYHFEGEDINMDDIFENIFGGAFNGSGFGTHSGFGGSRGWDRVHRNGSYGYGDGFAEDGFGGTGYEGGTYGSAFGGRGSDLNAEVEISFDEAAFGGKKTISLSGMDGQIRSYEINIPAGIETGKTIRLKGKGMPGRGGREAGDLLLKIRVKDKPGFRREGMDVYTTVKVPFSTAVLGGEVPVETIYGTVLCRIREGTQSGTKIRLKGKGIVSMKDASVRGDEYAVVEIEVPRHLSDEAKQKLKEFDDACVRRRYRRGA